MRLNRRKGFALISVLTIMLALTFLSAIIMDLTLNSHSTTMEMIQDKKLYNAAQSGIEWGIAMLVANRDALDNEIKTGISGITFDPANSAHLDAIRATMNEGTILDDTQPDPSMFGTGIAVHVDILDCNYDPPSNYDSFLPPIMHVTTGEGEDGSGTSGIPSGTSAIVDPSRVLGLGGAGDEFLAFVIRSSAVMNERTKTIETMVRVQR